MVDYNKKKMNMPVTRAEEETINEIIALAKSRRVKPSVIIQEALDRYVKKEEV
ncbi:hypothetical protein [Sulfurimonas sp.]|uniref:hypothetical protein n=1 Tax=Sulfurimonas sp. TaxID=2022749 RepID=UPI00356AB9AF